MNFDIIEKLTDEQLKDIFNEIIENNNDYFSSVWCTTCEGSDEERCKNFPGASQYVGFKACGIQYYYNGYDCCGIAHYCGSGVFGCNFVQR